MKQLFTTLFLLLAVLSKSQAQVSFGKAQLLNDDWLFLRADTAWNIFEHPDMKLPGYDDSHWRKLSLPHDWGVEQPMSPDKGSCQGYLPAGIAWYRKHLSSPSPLQSYPSIPSASLGEREGVFFLYFEGIYNHSEVYLNGHLLGKRPSGFAPLLYDITPYLNPEGDNVVAVRVDHSQEFDSRWYTGSGINRNVWLITAPETHLAPWGTAYRLKSIDSRKAVVEVDVEVASAPKKIKATVELKDAEGRTVATTQTTMGSQQQKKTVTLTVKHPHRWTLSDPYLYTLTTTLQNGDQSVVKAGLRTLQFSPDRGFALNGEWMKVKGVCIHDDAGVLGTAVPKRVWHRRLMELKALGANAIRMSHNPHTPELYDLCDELGLLVMDEASDEWEFPKRKWMKGWNQGRPSYQGTYTYFEEWIERDVADMVRRDRCHPSIFLWSVGNEVDYPNDPYSHPVLDGGGADFTQPAYGGYKPDQPHAERIGKIARRLAQVVKAIDPSRPTTGALAGVVMSNETLYPTSIDVVGYNYTESRYLTDHQRYPDRVIYGSENRHDLAAWLSVRDNDHIFGQFLWTGIDYLGESGVWPARGSSAGLLDLAGHRKPIGWYRAALWSEQPTCYIGSLPLPPTKGHRRPHVSPYAEDTWNYAEGQPVRVVCYTNAISARLLLNGQPVGGQPTLDKGSGILYWDIPYSPGTLRCEANNGSSYEIRTTKAPAALRVTTDSLCHVFVEIVDEDGNLVKTADNLVTLTVQGARLLGMENGNIMDTSVAGRTRRNQLRAHHGRLVAYIAPSPHGQPLHIRATSPFLKTAEVE